MAVGGPPAMAHFDSFLIVGGSLGYFAFFRKKGGVRLGYLDSSLGCIIWMYRLFHLDKLVTLLGASRRGFVLGLLLGLLLELYFLWFTFPPYFHRYFGYFSWGLGLGLTKDFSQSHRRLLPGEVPRPRIDRKN